MVALTTVFAMIPAIIGMMMVVIGETPFNNWNDLGTFFKVELIIF